MKNVCRRSIKVNFVFIVQNTKDQVTFVSGCFEETISKINTLSSAFIKQARKHGVVRTMLQSRKHIYIRIESYLLYLHVHLYYIDARKAL